MSLVVEKGGLLSLLQDYGRFHYQHYGITSGGPLDDHAFLWANRLLSNHYNAAQIEITLGGFCGRFLEPTMIAICGADASATLNGKPLKPWQTATVFKEDTIRFASPKNGMRTYLAVKGGFHGPQQLSSVATVTREKLGGLDQQGGALREKASIAYQASEHNQISFVPERFIPPYEHDVSVRFLPNHSIVGCSQLLIDDFSQQSYTVSAQSNRMASRLEGSMPLKQTSEGIISQGISLGAIQLPPDGQPIVLMKDRQTMGGYAQLGCVAQIDLPKLAQCRPGASISFIPSERRELEKALCEFYAFFDVSI